MGLLCKAVKLISLVGVAFLAFHTWKCCQNGGAHLDALKAYRQDGYYGRKVLKVGEKLPVDNVKIVPFKLNVSADVLNDLKYRLEHANFVEPLEDTKFHYGFSGDQLKQIVQYWNSKYDWRKAEAQLNSYPQFKTQIEGLDIHFVHVKPNKPAKKVVPIIVIHGWPGSFLEYYKSIPYLLETKNDVAFEVIIPSIPGYGYSEAAHKKGLNILSAGRIFVKLMKRLGHDKFVVHGGDWGNVITRSIALVFPENVLAAHFVGTFAPFPKTSCEIVNHLLAAYVPSLYFGSEEYQRQYSKAFPFGEKIVSILSESGYMHLQATKPDTIGAALTDTPAGLAAYILEKFSTWTNDKNLDLPDGGLTQKFTLDELLTNLMIYWTSGNVASSVRFYKESIVLALHELDLSRFKVVVPSAIIDPENDLAHSPRKLIEPYYPKLLQFTDLYKGGHFLAFEEPQIVTNDIRTFVDKVLKASEEAEQVPQKDEI